MRPGNYPQKILPLQILPGLGSRFGLGLGWGAIFQGTIFQGAIFLVPLKLLTGFSQLENKQIFNNR